MSHLLPLFLKNEKLARSQYVILDSIITITGAKTYADQQYPYTFPALYGYDSTDLTQTKVEAFLQHPSAITCATSFGSTALGTDTLGFVVDTAGLYLPNPAVVGQRPSVGQVASVAGLQVAANLGGTGSSYWVPGTPPSTTILPNTLPSAIGVSSDGDPYGHVVITGLDAATSGFIHLRFYLTAN